MRIRVATVASFLAAAALVAGEIELPPGLRDYGAWQAMTPAPVPVPHAAWYLCRPPYPSELDEAEREFGEHANHTIRVLVNQLAAGKFSDRKSPLPPGSIVVKEKLDGEAIAAVAAMIKHPPGYSEATGDWEFVFYGKDRKAAGGAPLQAHCSSCHASSRSSDFLFRNYLSAGDSSTSSP
jgi:hypothetical protein